MAQVVGGKVKLNNGQVITPQQGGWYDSQQFWGGTLSNPGDINSLSDQPGAGKAVSQEVNRQTSVAAGLAPDANQKYIQEQQAKAAAAKPTQPSATTAIPNAGLGAGGMAGGGAGIGTGMVTAPTLNLPDLYKNLSASAGLSDIEKDLMAKEARYNEVTAQINDNPWLSEGERTGRVQKLSMDYENKIANKRNELIMKKQDIQTQLDLATKQFDINSQASQQAWSQFNTLLSMGALDGASGNDIAGITAATGISSDMIQAAIKANKDKNTKTQVIQSTNDAGEVTVSVINPDTGEIISQKSLGAVGNTQKGAAGSEKTQSPAAQEASVELTVRDYISSEANQAQASPEDLYRLLLQNFPEASAYITKTWTPDKIRKKTK